jgi:hypothetical protein
MYLSVLWLFGRMRAEVLENLAPASQPTPPLVRYPGGVGVKIHAVFS